MGRKKCFCQSWCMGGRAAELLLLREKPAASTKAGTETWGRRCLILPPQRHRGGGTGAQWVPGVHLEMMETHLASWDCCEAARTWLQVTPCTGHAPVTVSHAPSPHISLLPPQGLHRDDGARADGGDVVHPWPLLAQTRRVQLHPPSISPLPPAPHSPLTPHPASRSFPAGR